MTDPKPRRINALPAEVDAFLRQRHNDVPQLAMAPLGLFRGGLIILANWATDPDRAADYAAIGTRGEALDAVVPKFAAEFADLTGVKVGMIDAAIVMGFVRMAEEYSPVKFAQYEALLAKGRGVTWDGQKLG